MDRVRDFSLSKRLELKDIADNIDRGLINDIAQLQYSTWNTSNLNLRDDMSNMEAYHKAAIDRYKGTAEKVDFIFDNCIGIGDKYGDEFDKLAVGFENYAEVLARFSSAIGRNDFEDNFDVNGLAQKIAPSCKKMQQCRWEMTLEATIQEGEALYEEYRHDGKWKELCKKKDLSNAEYIALALIYMNMETDEEITEFLSYMVESQGMTQEHSAPFENLPCEKWSINKNRINNITKWMDLYAASKFNDYKMLESMTIPELRAAMEEMVGKEEVDKLSDHEIRSYYEKAKNGLIEERLSIRQRQALLNTVKNLQTYCDDDIWDYPEGEVWTFWGNPISSVRKNERGDYELTYTSAHVDATFDWTKGTPVMIDPTDKHQRPPRMPFLESARVVRTITVSNTLDGDGASAFERDISNAYAAGEMEVKVIREEIPKETVKYVSKDAAKRSAKIIIEKIPGMAKNFSGPVGVTIDVAFIAATIAEKEIASQERLQELQNYEDVSKELTIADRFSFEINIVHQENTQMSVSYCEGCSTQRVIDNFNEYIRGQRMKAQHNPIYDDVGPVTAEALLNMDEDTKNKILAIIHDIEAHDKAELRKVFGDQYYVIDKQGQSFTVNFPEEKQKILDEE